MVNNKGQLVGESDVPFRRRGRPAGKNRIPLSREERRARNAQYERERRNETAEVMSQLVEAVNCDPNISNAELLATVISRIQRASRKKTEDITELERVNANLEAQIATLQSRLGLDDASFALIDNENNDQEKNTPQSNSETNININNRSKKRKRSERLCSDHIQQEKRTKTQSETWSVDSGIELMSHTVSTPPPAQAPCLQDNTQYLTHSEQQSPVEISEEQDHNVSQAHIELQTELYNQIYNSENQSSGSMPAWDVGSLTQTIPCMESLCRSLIVVPSIIAPQQDSPDLRVEHNTQPEIMSLQNVEPSCDLNDTNLCDFLPQHDELPTLDFLTDTEKCLLTDWIGEDLLQTSEFNDDAQMQVRSYQIDNLPGYS